MGAYRSRRVPGTTTASNSAPQPTAVTYQGDDATVNLNDGYDDSIVLLGDLYRDGGDSVDSRAFAISFSDGSAFGLNSRMAFTYGGRLGYIMRIRR